MAQHYLMSAEVCDMDREEIDILDKEGAVRYMANIRWPDGKQVCPGCGTVANHWWRKNRCHWRCCECSREFSVMSGTIFQDSKLPIKKLLKALFRYSITAKGSAALELRKEICVHYKTAWLISSKIREVLMRTRNTGPLSGVVHVDGGYFGGKRRDVNNHGHRSPEHQAAAVKAKYEGAPTQRARRRKHLPGGKQNAERRKKRRVVLVLRQAHPERGCGAVRTIVSVAHSENEKDALAFIKKYVEDGSAIMSDEGVAFSGLSAHGYQHDAVEHRMMYSRPKPNSDETVNNNHAESFFSRLRRAEYGVFHRFEPRYMMDYANEAAWREDWRRMSVRQRFEGLIRLIFQAGLSRWFRGYYQGNRRQYELLNQ